MNIRTFHYWVAVPILAGFMAGFVVGIKCTLAIVEHGQAPATTAAPLAPATPRPAPLPTPRVVVPTNGHTFTI